MSHTLMFIVQSVVLLKGFKYSRYVPSVVDKFHLQTYQVYWDLKEYQISLLGFRGNRSDNPISPRIYYMSTFRQGCFLSTCFISSKFLRVVQTVYFISITMIARNQMIKQHKSFYPWDKISFQFCGFRLRKLQRKS